VVLPDTPGGRAETGAVDPYELLLEMLRNCSWMMDTELTPHFLPSPSGSVR